jgi:hypothetical protein
MQIVSIQLFVGMLSICMLSAAPLVVEASDDRCEYSASRDADLNLAGIKTIVFDIGPHRLNLKGDKASSGSVRGSACASDPKRLAELTITQRRDGDKLIVRAERNRLLRKGSWSGDDYGRLSLDANIPSRLPLRVLVGSGDALIDGVYSMSADVNSGTLVARHVGDTLFADVGSGNIEATDIGALHVVSVGSGELKARDVRGNVRVGEINSGEFSVANANGSTRIGSIGSGDASITAAGGDINVESIGSGDLKVEGARGNLFVDRVGSGSVHHRDIQGQVRIPKDD